MRSAEGAPGTTANTPAPAGDTVARSRPPLLLLATAALVLEAAGLCVVVAANAIDLASGNTYQASNAIALIVLEVIVAAGVALFGRAVARLRPWSRTPAVMAQVVTAIIGIWLVQAHRYGWGTPALLLAVAGLAGLFAPASLRALSRSAGPRGTTPR